MLHDDYTCPACGHDVYWMNPGHAIGNNRKYESVIMTPILMAYECSRFQLTPIVDKTWWTRAKLEPTPVGFAGDL